MIKLVNADLRCFKFSKTNDAFIVGTTQKCIFCYFTTKYIHNEDWGQSERFKTFSLLHSFLFASAFTPKTDFLLLLVAQDQQWNPLRQHESEDCRPYPKGHLAKVNEHVSYLMVLNETAYKGLPCHSICWQPVWIVLENLFWRAGPFNSKGKKTDCCSDINQTGTPWWLCYTSGRSRVHGLKQAI